MHVQNLQNTQSTTYLTFKMFAKTPTLCKQSEAKNLHLLVSIQKKGGLLFPFLRIDFDRKSINVS